MRIGVDLGGTKIEAAVMDDAGVIIESQRVETPRGSYRRTVEKVKALVLGLETHLSVRANVGVATPGTISPVTGLMKNANSTALNGQPLDVDLEQALCRTVRLANDADCFALSEAVDGAGRDAQVVFGAILGTGTGAGIVVGGTLLRGPNAVAGEWGHNPLPAPTACELPGPPCYCGRRGCIETFLSGPGLIADYAQDPTDPPVDIVRVEQLVSRAATGEVAAISVFERYYDRLARALGQVVNVLDPDVIVLGGGLSNLEAIYTEIPNRWLGYVFSDVVTTPIRPPEYGDSSGVRGAAWLWEPKESVSAPNARSR